MPWFSRPCAQTAEKQRGDRMAEEKKPKNNAKVEEARAKVAAGFYERERAIKTAIDRIIKIHHRRAA
jgi:hypothetical protein